MTFIEDQHPRGHATNSGAFSEKTQGQPEISVFAAASRDESGQENFFRFTVTVHCETPEQASIVMTERLGHDEEYGFDYTITEVAL